MSATPKARKASNLINAAVTAALQRDGYAGQAHQVGSDPELPLDTDVVLLTGETIQAGTESTSPSAEPTRNESPEPVNQVENEGEVQASSQKSDLFTTESERDARERERDLKEMKRQDKLNVPGSGPVTPPRRGTTSRDEPGSSSEASSTPTPSESHSKPVKSKGKGHAISTGLPLKPNALRSAGPRGNQVYGDFRPRLPVASNSQGSPRAPTSKGGSKRTASEIDGGSGRKSSSSRTPVSALTVAKKRPKNRNASPEADSGSMSSPAKDKAILKGNLRGCTGTTSFGTDKRGRKPATVLIPAGIAATTLRMKKTQASAQFDRVVHCEDPKTVKIAASIYRTEYPEIGPPL
ncbi:hypothetical protein FRC09_005189 [Ceratobasidium sp. 395]|nr:hypothetical protein FRC09_005189 [Ceratobasidium sp. 395]